MELDGIEVLCKDIFLNAKWENRICVLFEEGEIYEKLKEKSDKIFSLKKENRNKEKIVEKIVQYCNKEKIDIITVHHGGVSCNIIYIMLKKKLKNVKFVRYLHGSFDQYSFGNGENKLKDIVVKKVMKKAFDVSDLLVFISKAVEKTFTDVFKIDNKNKAIIYNGINNTFFNNISEEKKEDIIYVGRLSKVKGLDVFLNALNKVYDKNQNVSTTFVGDGEERQKLEKMVQDFKMEDKVQFVGTQSNVINWLDSKSIFVYPSICAEGFGISVAEAMSRGCIPVAFRKGGLPELIENGKNGYLIDEVSEEKLANKILDILKLSNEEIEELRKNAIQTSRNFSIDNTINELEGQYKKLIDRKN